ncbi:MAG: hypothetical protein HYZ68_05385 [Chloroflexi bacterium]|nr:hypothetical protein [Chloroflexota bacterium]
MSSATLIRWSGAVTVLAGVVYILSRLLHPSGDDAAAVLNSPWMAIHTGMMLSALLLLFGLMGMYARQRERAGTLGLIGFVVAFLGTGLYAGFMYHEAYISPVLAIEAPALLGEGGPLFAGPTFLAFSLTFIIFLLGYVLFGIATIRAGVLPRWGATLAIVGAVPISLVPFFPFVVVTLGGVVFGAGVVWLGYALWSGD